MKPYGLFFIVVFWTITGIAQSVATNEDVSEFLPYQIMSFLTTTLDATTTKVSESDGSQLIPYRIGQLWGYCDVNKKIKIPVQYEYASLFYANVAYVKKEGEYFFINSNGKKLSTVNWIASNSEYTYSAALNGAQDNTYSLVRGSKNTEEIEGIRINNNSSNGLLKVWNKAERSGVVDIYGSTIVPIRFDNISFVEEEMILTLLDRKFGMYSKEGVEVSIPKYDWIGAFENGIAKVVMSRRYGYINTDGKEVIPTQYSAAYRQNEYIIASDGKGSKGVFDQKGKVIIPFQYTDVRPLNKTFFSVRNTAGKYGIIDQSNTIVQPFIYNAINADDGTIFIALSEEGYVYLNGTTGKPLTDKKYKKADRFDDRPLARVANDSYKKGFIDRKGKEIIPPQWYSADWFKNGYSKVRVSSDGSTTGLINTKGQLVVNTVYSDIIVFEQSKRAAVRNWKTNEGKWAFMNFEGKLLSPFIYDGVQKKKNGYAIVEKEGVKGVLDASGKEILPFEYDYISLVKDTYFIVKNKQGYYGTYDRRGKVLESCQYNYIYKTTNGIAIVESQERKMGIINTKGQFSSAGFYDEIYPPKYRNQKTAAPYFVAAKGTLKGILNQEGEVLIPPKYYKLYYVINELALVDVTGEGKEYGYVGSNGIEYFEK